MLFQTKKTILLTFTIFSFISFQGFAQQVVGDINIESSSEIDQLLAQKKKYNKNLNELNGFKIQLYYGNEKEAYEIKDEFDALFPEIKSKVNFGRPDWNVQVGNYKTRLQADRSLVEIKKEYPSAIIFATEIEDEN